MGWKIKSNIRFFRWKFFRWMRMVILVRADAWGLRWMGYYVRFFSCQGGATLGTGSSLQLWWTSLFKKIIITRHYLKMKNNTLTVFFVCLMSFIFDKWKHLVPNLMESRSWYTSCSPPDVTWSYSWSIGEALRRFWLHLGFVWISVRFQWRCEIQFGRKTTPP